MIEVKNVYRYYENNTGGKIAALTNINFTVSKGDIFAIIGKSGAGKSTLLRCLNLLEFPDQGSVSINHIELTQLNKKTLREARKKIGMIFQHFNLLSALTVYQNIALPLQFSNLDKVTIHKTIMPLLTLTNLTDKQHAYPAQLSGGEKQRVAIARALVNNPHVLLCDEATSALDPETTQSILTLLHDINKKLQLTIVLVTHEIGVVKAIANRLLLLDKGCVVKQSSVLDFFTHSQDSAENDFARHYFQHQLPEVLQQVLLPHYIEQTQAVIKIYFRGMVITQPIIMQLVSIFHVEINILQANIEYIQHGAVGFVLIALQDPQTHVTTIMNYLHQQGLIAEILGYVKRDAIQLA
jgi:D-methionine transport system ATP-binding protein